MTLTLTQPSFLRSCCCTTTRTLKIISEVNTNHIHFVFFFNDLVNLLCQNDFSCFVGLTACTLHDINEWPFVILWCDLSVTIKLIIIYYVRLFLFIKKCTFLPMQNRSKSLYCVFYRPKVLCCCTTILVVSGYTSYMSQKWTRWAIHRQ